MLYNIPSSFLINSVKPDTIRLGDQNLIRTDDKAEPQDFHIADVIVHPDYKHSSHYNDIALIKLDRQIRYTTNIFLDLFITSKCFYLHWYFFLLVLLNLYDLHVCGKI